MITIHQFELAVRATIENQLSKSIMVLGPTGVGKSQVVHQIAASYDMDVIDVRLLLWSLTDLKGIPYPDDTHTYTKWLANDVLPRVDRDKERGILLLEELPSAPKTVQAAAYQLTLDKKIGDYQLPDGWIIIATGNREQDNGVYVAPPAPLADRFEIHEVDIDFVTWRDFAVKDGANPLVVSYLSANETALYTFDPENTAELVFASPRSWMDVSDLLNHKLSGETLRIKIEGNIGSLQTAGFLKYLESCQFLPNIDALLHGVLGKDVAPKYNQNASVDAHYLLIQNLLFRINHEYHKESDEWKSFVDNSICFIDSLKNFPVEMYKSFIEQLSKVDEDIKKYILVDSRNQKSSRIFQFLDHIGIKP